MMKLFLVAFLLLLQLHQTTTKRDHQTKSNGLMIKIIHHDSRKLPFYDPKLTLKDRVRRMDMRSEARISQLTIDHDLEKNTNEFQIYPLYSSEFLVPLKIGTPLVPQTLAMDTGSLLLWVHCIDGQRAISLISQLNYTGFSYCIGNINDKNYDLNTLVLGGEPIIVAASTPMFMVIGTYYITLEKISVGDKFLDINSSIFKRIDYEGGMLVDRGATSTYLPDISFNELKEEIRYVIGTTLKEHISSRPDELCYRGTIIEFRL